MNTETEQAMSEMNEYQRRPMQVDGVRVILKCSNGEIYRGSVFGCCGQVREVARIEQSIRRMTKGRPSHLYEPLPGHVMMYLCEPGDLEGQPLFVDARGATVTEDISPLR